MRIRMIAVATGVAMTAALLAGCTSDEDSSLGDSPTAASSTADASPAATTAAVEASPSAEGDTSRPPAEGAPSTPLDALGAMVVAERAIPAGTVVEVDLDDENGRQVWSVLVRDDSVMGRELYVDLNTGEVVRETQEALPVEAQGDLPPLTAQQGIEAALEAVEESSVVAFDLGTENGSTVWAVLVTAGGGLTEVYVDATSGAILKQEAGE